MGLSLGELMRRLTAAQPNWKKEAEKDGGSILGAPVVEQEKNMRIEWPTSQPETSPKTEVGPLLEQTAVHVVAARDKPRRSAPGEGGLKGSGRVEFSASTPVSRPDPPEAKKINQQMVFSTLPTAALVCDSVTASRSKCFFGEFGTTPSTPPKFYLKFETVDSTSQSYSSVGTGGGSTETVDSSTTTRVSTTFDPTTCTGTTTPTTCEGGSEYSKTFSGGTPPANTGSCTLEDDCTVSCLTTSGHPPSGYLSSGYFYAECGGPGTVCSSPPDDITRTTRDSTRDCSTSNPPEQPGVSCVSNVSRHQELSDEYTTDMLKSNTITALPIYSGIYGCGGSHTTGQGCICSALYALSSDESSFSLRRFRYKFLLNAPSHGFKITWNEQFVPTLSADVTYMGTLYHAGSADPNPAHWSHNPKSYEVLRIDPPVSESGVYTCPDPAGNGVTSVADVMVLPSSDADDGDVLAMIDLPPGVPGVPI